MTSHQAPRRPSPGVRPAPTSPAGDPSPARRRPRPVASAALPAQESPPAARHRATGSGSGNTGPWARSAALLRGPGAARRWSLAAVGAGVAVFVAAAVITPLAGADPRAHGNHHGQQHDNGPALSLELPTGSSSPAAATSSAPARTSRKTISSKPTHVAHQASDDSSVISGLAANGIPTVALNAYRVAAARVDHDDPGCGIDWALLAGIGREESDHGQFGGAVLHADGVSTPAIIGPALDGVHYDYIPAPANGLALDGDAKYAHALGPMQFIPSTWAIYGADADGDGKANVFDINDAALGAARYLCAAGGNLRTRAGQVAAVLAYNHSDQYLAQVLALAAAYRSGVPVTGSPRGNTTGALPGLGSGGGYIPPANPGAPTAVHKSSGKHKTGSAGGATTPPKTLGGGSGSGGSGSSASKTASSGSHSSGGAAPTKGTHPTSGSSSTTPGSGGGSSSSPTPDPTDPGSTPTPTGGSTCVLGVVCVPS